MISMHPAAGRQEKYLTWQRPDVPERGQRTASFSELEPEYIAHQTHVAPPGMHPRSRSADGPLYLV
jgi:hypothetical protein